jgi:uncharacterized protein involved in outer membrane biogenesis
VKPIRKRRLAVVVAAMIVLMIAGETLIESFGPTEIVRIVERRLSKATGLNVQLGGDFHLEILPVLRFEAPGSGQIVDK